jgi:hypothetical protein
MKLKYLYVILFLGLLSTSCTKDFEDINTNPNNPSTTDPNYLFNYVLKEISGEYDIYNTYNYTYIQRWIMQTSAVYGNSDMPPYTIFDQYRIQLLWEYFYSDIGLNNEMLIKMTANDPELVNKQQVARIWKAYSFHKVTDLWGDVPYSKAWGIIDEYNSKVIQPEYDTQEVIYNNLLAELKDAASKMDASKEFFPEDIIYDGDIDNWVKFANSLRLRLAVRSGNEAVVHEIITENNLISSNDESAVFQYIESQDWWSPYYSLHINSVNPTNPEGTGTSSPKIAELMKKQLADNGDPRLPIYAQPAETDNITYIGVPNLMNATLKENQAMGMGVQSTSYIGKYFTRNPTLKKQLLSYAEVCFLRAEAAFRTWTTENAQFWYEEGVKSAMEFYEVEADDITDFLANGGAYDGTLEQIMTQKWVALFLDGWEAFADYRRTGYPQLMKWDLELDGIKIKKATWVEVPRDYLPGRLPYPDDEVDLNNTNYLKAVENQGGDSYYQQLWWSKKFGTIDYSAEK